MLGRRIPRRRPFEAAPPFPPTPASEFSLPAPNPMTNESGSPSEADSSPDDPATDALNEAASSLRRVDLGEADDGEPANGLARLVLSLVQLLHDVLEKQAIRRMEGGTLTDDEIERIGRTLMRQSETIDDLCDAFDLDRSDLDLPIGTVQTVDDDSDAPLV